jgi:hypothetical protein
MLSSGLPGLHFGIDKAHPGDDQTSAALGPALVIIHKTVAEGPPPAGESRGPHGGHYGSIPYLNISDLSWFKQPAILHLGTPLYSKTTNKVVVISITDSIWTNRV